MDGLRGHSELRFAHHISGEDFHPIIFCQRCTVTAFYFKRGVHTLNEANRTKEKIMSLQTIRVAPGQAQTVGSDRETHDDLGYRGANRECEVTVPLPIRILHGFFVVGTVTIIVMLMLGL
jgi:hypothetical protein